MPSKSVEVWFATSNSHKFREASEIVKEYGITLRRLPAKGRELQSDSVREIAGSAALETFASVRKPLIAEDTGLFINALNGFPGPYSSYVQETVGNAAILHLLESTEDRGAEFVTAVAYCREPSKVRVFVGRLKGRISDAVRGANGFGFDPIFIPAGSARTLAEMTTHEKNHTSHRYLALRAFGLWRNRVRAG